MMRRGQTRTGTNGHGPTRTSTEGRGRAASVELLDQPTAGFLVDRWALHDMRQVLRRVLPGIASSLSGAQQRILEGFYVTWGMAESCYTIDRRGVKQTFSVARQVGGPACGWLQIEPATALSVIREVLAAKLEGKALYEEIDIGALATIGLRLEAIRDEIEQRPVEILQSHGIGILILRLKLGNRSFRLGRGKWIPGFGPLAGREPTLVESAKIWKAVWNTEAGKGTSEGFLQKVRLHRCLIRGEGGNEPQRSQRTQRDEMD